MHRVDTYFKIFQNKKIFGADRILIRQQIFVELVVELTNTVFVNSTNTSTNIETAILITFFKVRNRFRMEEIRLYDSPFKELADQVHLERFKSWLLSKKYMMTLIILGIFLCRTIFYCLQVI